MKTRLLCPYGMPLNEWRSQFPRPFKSISLLFLFTLIFVSSKTFSQVAPVAAPTGGFNIDGKLEAATTPYGDWLQGSSSGGFVLDGTNAGNPINPSTTFHIVDLYNSGVDDNFAGGLKFNDNPNVWTWVNNPVGAKVDINNALVHFSRDANNHIWAMVAADRRSDKGDAYIDFEFLQNTDRK